MHKKKLKGPQQTKQWSLQREVGLQRINVKGEG